MRLITNLWRQRSTQHNAHLLPSISRFPRFLADDCVRRFDSDGHATVYDRSILRKAAERLEDAGIRLAAPEVKTGSDLERKLMTAVRDAAAR